MSEFHGASLAQADRPINSNGKSFSTIQEAVDELAGDGFVYVPAGTWSEALTISDNNVELFGAGWATIIDGGTTGHAIYITSTGCTVRDLQALTTAGIGNVYEALKVEVTGGDCSFINCYVSASDNRGIHVARSNTLVMGCRVEGCDGYGVDIAVGLSRMIGNYVDEQVRTTGAGDDSIIAGNYITGASTIHADSENCVWDSNRNPGGVTDNSGTSTVGDNDET